MSLPAIFFGIDREKPAVFSTKWTPAKKNASLRYFEWVYANSNLRWLGGYLMPGDSRGWNSLVSGLRAQGWGILMTTVLGNGINPYNQGAAAGSAFALQMKALARQIGLEPGTVLYIDSEHQNSSAVTPQQLAFFEAYARTLGDPSQPPAYRAGFYSQPNITGHISCYIPGVYIWPIFLRTQALTQTFTAPFAVHGNRVEIEPERLPQIINTMHDPNINTAPHVNTPSIVINSVARSRVSPTPQSAHGAPPVMDRVFPVAQQFWYMNMRQNRLPFPGENKNTPYFASDPKRFPATLPPANLLPKGLLAEANWDFSAGLVRDPSFPVAEPRCCGALLAGTPVLITLSNLEPATRRQFRSGGLAIKFPGLELDTSGHSGWIAHPAGPIAAVCVRQHLPGPTLYLAFAGRENDSAPIRVLVRQAFVRSAKQPGQLIGAANTGVQDYRMVSALGGAPRQPFQFQMLSPDGEQPMLFFFTEKNLLAWIVLTAQGSISEISYLTVHIQSGLAASASTPTDVFVCLFDAQSTLYSIRFQRSGEGIIQRWIAGAPLRISTPNAAMHPITGSLAVVGVEARSVLCFGISNNLRLVVSEFQLNAWTAWREVGQTSDLIHPHSAISAIRVSPERIVLIAIDTQAKLRVFTFTRSPALTPVQNKPSVAARPWRFDAGAQVVHVAGGQQGERFINPFSDLSLFSDEKGALIASLVIAKRPGKALLISLPSGTVVT